MRSKTSKQVTSKSKTPKPPRFQVWKVETDCSEDEVLKTACKLALELKAGDRVLMEGPMGAGKTTFSRALLEGLGVQQPAEGSPTFALAHEYATPRFEVVHIDFYRLRGESEIEEAGIDAYFWERDAIVIAEWASLWPEFERAILETTDVCNWKVEIAYAQSEQISLRDLTIRRFFSKG
jgi:tRNA threonylcarbamoyladenosine biosynthesis protein TsaE